MTTNKKSIGAQLIESMTEFAAALESGEPLEKRLTGHTIRLDIVPGRYTPAQVRTVRRLLGVSQSIFAQFLGVATTTVRSWEQGTNRPSGAAARLMDEIQSEPEHFRLRLRQAAVVHASRPSAGIRQRKSPRIPSKTARRRSPVLSKHRRSRKSHIAR